MIAAELERDESPRAMGSTPSLPPGALSAAARSSVARAPFVRELACVEDDEQTAQARADVRNGLTYSHDHVKRLLVPDWRSVGSAPSTPPGLALAIVWTRTADMMHLGNREREQALHRALEQFAATGAGNVFAEIRPNEYRLHAHGFRVHFVMDGAKMVILSARTDDGSRSKP